ncbi:unnamed protein product [Lactuca virosa]|uniref:Uncharacterized protein n=1 Tax=Lactuca virosa TaxID=75947 RepID=A0AAU9NAC3_9ASTR|nr:unnamed protein product [Lactuca virosa]
MKRCLVLSTFFLSFIFAIDSPSLILSPLDLPSFSTSCLSVNPKPSPPPFSLARSREIYKLPFLSFSLNTLCPSRGFHQAPAIAAPVNSEALETRKSKSKQGVNNWKDHEFSDYTRRLLETVSRLVRIIEEVSSGNGDLKNVEAALKDVKLKKKELQYEIMTRLYAELSVLRGKKMELDRKSGDILDSMMKSKRERKIGFWKEVGKRRPRSMCWQKTDIKTKLLEDAEFGKEYVAQKQERILLDHDRVSSRTWYNEERKRWEIQPIAIPYAVSRKLVENARIRHDWAAMYLTLKGDDKEFYVNLKEFDMMFDDFGGVDGLYLKMLASNVPTDIQLMWIPFPELDIRQQFLFPIRLSRQLLIWLGKFNLRDLSAVNMIIHWVHNMTKKIMAIIVFPILDFVIPYQKYFFRARLQRAKAKKKEGVDPITHAFDQLKRVKNPPIRLKDFASVEFMKEEINEVVAFLQNPRAFQEMGARPPRVCNM